MTKKNKKYHFIFILSSDLCFNQALKKGLDTINTKATYEQP
ncbi:hypothetical protein [Campylobacter hyointestinalis]|nr:hypothetical protein [Campylobacter hyointestinalis]